MSYEQVSVADGKYTILIGEGADGGQLKALRNGEPWQDLTGNKMVYCLASELQEARRAIAATEQAAAQKVEDRSGHEIIEAALAEATDGDPNKAPAGMSHEASCAYLSGMAAAYAHALEMIPAPPAKTCAEAPEAPAAASEFPRHR